MKRILIVLLCAFILPTISKYAQITVSANTDCNEMVKLDYHRSETCPAYIKEENLYTKRQILDKEIPFPEYFKTDGVNSDTFYKVVAQTPINEDFIIFPVEYNYSFNKKKYRRDKSEYYINKKKEFEDAANAYAIIHNKYLGKKFPNQHLKETAQSLISLIESGQNVTPEDTEYRSIVESISAKDLSKIKADYNKGKFSSKFKNILVALNLKMKEDAETMKQKYKYYSYNDLGSIIKTEDPELYEFYIDGLKIKYYDTVPNPESQSNLWKVWDKNKYTFIKKTSNIKNGYEWVYNEDYNIRDEKYPIPVGFRQYSSHPDLRITKSQYIEEGREVPSIPNYAIWDSKGNLVAVSDIPFDTYYFEDYGHGRNIYEIASELYRIAWEENKYNIKSQPQLVTHYVKVKAGIEDLTPAEKAKQKKLDLESKQAYNNYTKASDYYDKTGRGKKAMNLAAAKAFLSYGSGLTNSDEGFNWCAQIINDNKPILESIYSIERIDGTTFRGVYVDSNHKPCYEIIIKYEADKPYRLTNPKCNLKRLK